MYSVERAAFTNSYLRSPILGALSFVMFQRHHPSTASQQEPEDAKLNLVWIQTSHDLLHIGNEMHGGNP